MSVSSCPADPITFNSISKAMSLIASQLLVGARTSILVGVVAVLIGMIALNFVLSFTKIRLDLTEDGRIGRVRGAADNSYTAGVICAKVARYAERLYHPDRLMKPVRRAGAKGAGQWQDVTWEAALDEIANAFDLRANHVCNCVTASAANPNNCDFRLQFVNHWWPDIDAHNFIPLAPSACSKFSCF